MRMHYLYTLMGFILAFSHMCIMDFYYFLHYFHHLSPSTPIDHPHLPPSNSVSVYVRPNGFDEQIYNSPCFTVQYFLFFFPKWHYVLWKPLHSRQHIHPWIILPSRAPDSYFQLESFLHHALFSNFYKRNGKTMTTATKCHRLIFKHMGNVNHTASS